MPIETKDPVSPYSVSVLTIDDAMDIAMWRTPGPWHVEDSLEPPRPDEGYWAVRDANNHLIGYCCFGETARPLGLASAPGKLDVALGLDPRFAGRHLSGGFADVVVAHARKVADTRGLRCAVQDWNALGRHTTEAAGFKVVGQHNVTGGRKTTTYFVYEM